MKSVRIRNSISLGLNITMLVLVAMAISWFFSGNALGMDVKSLLGTELGQDLISKYGDGLGTDFASMQIGGATTFMFFTNDSNILAALCCLLMIPFNIKGIITGRDEIPRWAMIVKYIGTAAVTVTMMVVLLFLGPTMGYDLMFMGSLLELHLLCPLIAIVSFCFFDRGAVLSRKELLWGVLPVVVYGIVYLVNVIFAESWVDFYGFNIGGYWYLAFAAMIIATVAFALGLRVIHNRFEKNGTRMHQLYSSSIYGKISEN